MLLSVSVVKNFILFNVISDFKHELIAVLLGWILLFADTHCIRLSCFLFFAFSVKSS